MLETLLSQFLSSLHSESTRTNYQSALRDFIHSFNKLDEMTLDAIEDYKESLLKQRKSKHTINARLAAIRSFLDYCWTKGLIRDNPALRVQNETAKRYKNCKNITVQDFRKLLQETNLTLKGLRDGLLIRLIYFYGDIKRVLNFKWDQPMPTPKLAKLKQKIITSLQKYLKRTYKDDTYLAQQHFQQFQKGYLFFSFEKSIPQPKEHLTEISVRKMMQQYCLKAGLPEHHIGFQALKRLRAREIYKKTGSVEQVQRFCGHQDIRITKEFLKTLKG